MSKHHGGKQYIHADNWVITTKFDKNLMYVPIWEPNQWELDNLERVILTSDHTLYPESINDKLEGSVILPSDNEVDTDLDD